MRDRIQSAFEGLSVDSDIIEELSLAARPAIVAAGHQASAGGDSAIFFGRVRIRSTG